MFRISFVLSVLLIVGGFFCPPIGVIDGSVLTAVGLLLMFSIVGKLPEAIKAGKSVKIRKEISWQKLVLNKKIMRIMFSNHSASLQTPSSIEH